MEKFLIVVYFLFCTSGNNTKMQNIYTNSESLIQLEQLAYLKFYFNVSTLKVTDGQGQRSDQPHTRRATTDGPVGADAGKQGPQRVFVFFS